MKNNLKPLLTEIENHLKLVNKDDVNDVADALNKIIFLMREGAQGVNTSGFYKKDYRFKTLELIIRYI